jgi:DNA-directed RNA polymerase subunit RPC12/RpoP
MALVKCNECDREMSDTLDSCPHCGYRVAPEHPIALTQKSTPLGVRKRGFVSGVLLLLLAALLLRAGIRSFEDGVRAVSLLSCFGVSISGFFGVYNIIGWYNVVCPNCEKEIRIRRYSQSLKCHYCKKISVRKGNMLEAVA